MPQCSGVKRDGGRCTASVRPPLTHCYAHDPDRAAERKRNASRAGRTRPNVEVASIRDQLSALYENVAAGTVSEKRAAVLCQISNTQLRAAEAERRAELESADLVDKAEVMELIGAFGDAVRETVRDREILELIWVRVEPMIHAFSERRIRPP